MINVPEHGVPPIDDSCFICRDDIPGQRLMPLPCDCKNLRIHGHCLNRLFRSMGQPLSCVSHPERGMVSHEHKCRTCTKVFTAEYNLVDDNLLVVRRVARIVNEILVEAYERAHRLSMQDPICGVVVLAMNLLITYQVVTLLMAQHHTLTTMGIWGRPLLWSMSTAWTQLYTCAQRSHAYLSHDLFRPHRSGRAVGAWVVYWRLAWWCIAQALFVWLPIVAIEIIWSYGVAWWGPLTEPLSWLCQVDILITAVVLPHAVRRCVGLAYEAMQLWVTTATMLYLIGCNLIELVKTLTRPKLELRLGTVG